jgi:hypothetical protein
MDARSPEVDPRRIRIGLAIIGVIFVAAVVLFVVVDDPLGRAIFVGVGLVCIVRMLLLVRWVRGRDVTPPPG